MDNISGLTPESQRATSFLEGAVFPADKDTLIAHASLQGAPEESLQILQLIPDKSYGSLSEVVDEINDRISRQA